MVTPNEPPRDPDSLAGSPELFATNLLLVRAIENEIDRITIERTSSEITVQLIKEDTDYDPETLTERTDKWNDIVERFRDHTRPDETDGGWGIVLEPNIPAADSVEDFRIEIDENRIEIRLTH